MKKTFHSDRYGDLEKKIEMLIKAAEKVYPSMGKLLWRSFLHGIFTALGATIGVSIVLGVLTYILSLLQIAPFISQFTGQIPLQ